MIHRIPPTSRSWTIMLFWGLSGLAGPGGAAWAQGAGPKADRDLLLVIGSSKSGEAMVALGGTVRSTGR
jgi:hypothetical protein